MKKVFWGIFITLVLSSCASGIYNPGQSHYVFNTNVLLSQANFRIVRNIDITVEINNSNLKRVDVEKSAYAELLRQANLTGSQALANIVVEEVRRENVSLFSLFRFTHYKQYVSAHASVIEFLDANGQPIMSNNITLTPSSFPNSVNQKEDTLKTEISDAGEAMNLAERLSTLTQQKYAVSSKYSSWNLLRSPFYVSYIEVYDYLTNTPTEINIVNLETIQRYVNKIMQGFASSFKIEKELKIAYNTEEKIQIFLSYAK